MKPDRRSSGGSCQRETLIGVGVEVASTVASFMQRIRRATKRREEKRIEQNRTEGSIS